MLSLGKKYLYPLQNYDVKLFRRKKLLRNLTSYVYLKPRWLRIHQTMVVSNKSAAIIRKLKKIFFRGEALDPLSIVFNNLGFLGISFPSSSSWSSNLLLPGLFMLFLEPVRSSKAQCPYLFLMLENFLSIFSCFNHKP